MKSIWYVIGDAGDGSNFIEWVIDKKVLDKLKEKADEGDEAYSSGDGFQCKQLSFPDDFDLIAWAEDNHLMVTTLDDIDEDI